MKRSPKAGLLPLYLKLYDDVRPETRKEYDGLIAGVVRELKKRGVETARADVCRVAPEFRAATAAFRKADVDAIVTLHLAYSPSLESVDALAGSRTPIVILDATMDAGFGAGVDPKRIMYNHGIHGVMDMACMLRRRGKAFRIVAGHAGDPKVTDRAADMVKAAYAARAFRSMKALRVGESFRGMGDFSVDAGTMRRVLGISVRQVGIRELEKAAGAVTAKAVRAEMAEDRRRFAGRVPAEVHERSVRAGLGLRRLLESGGYGAFSMNFLAFDRAEGPANTVPFLEASKAMGRGVGYGGEGDVLTASLVGALAQGWAETTFTEIFCPDWKGNSLFLSHMGEVNPLVAAKKAELMEKDYRFTAARNPAVITCAPKPGPAVFVNLVPGPGDRFDLIVAPVTVLGDTKRADMKKSVRGWIRPACGVAAFLEAYSRAGGTHHSALVLGDKAEAIEAFGAFAGIASCRI